MEIKALKTALERRKSLFTATALRQTNCFRLFSAELEDVPGLVVEEFNGVVILQVHEGAFSGTSDDLEKIAHWYLAERKAKSVYVKTFVADRTRQTAGSEYYSETPLAGEVCPDVIQVRENGLQYWIHPHDGYSTGLFLDQRENRRFLALRAGGCTVLNLFAYTCGFSVAAAKADAQVVSVDLSAKYLDWGKRNFLLNEISQERHEFVAMDTFDFLEKCRRQGRVFDLIIIDPPSFSRSKKRGTFSLKKDFSKLMGAALSVTRPGSEVFFSCNFSLWDSSDLRQKVEQLKIGPVRWHRLPAAPVDFQREKNPLSQIFFEIRPS